MELSQQFQSFFVPVGEWKWRTLRPNLLCCNVLHHRVWNAPALHNRSRLRHHKSHGMRQTHILRWGFSWHRRLMGRRESESPAAREVCSSSSVSPNISHSSQRIYISRVPNNVSLRSYRFSCLCWFARPFGHVIIRRRYYPQCWIAACSSSSIVSGYVARHHRVLLCNVQPRERSRVIRRIRAAARRHAGNKKKPEICCTATHQTLSLTFHKIRRKRDLLDKLGRRKSVAWIRFSS